MYREKIKKININFKLIPLIASVPLFKASIPSDEFLIISVSNSSKVYFTGTIIFGLGGSSGDFSKIVLSENIKHNN